MSLKQNQVAQLDKAEAMVQDAIKKLLNPNATATDKAQAAQEIAEAGQIRQQVAQGLNPQQQQVLWQIGKLEWSAFQTVTGGASFGQVLDPVKAMSQAAQLSQELDNSILSA